MDIYEYLFSNHRYIYLTGPESTFLHAYPLSWQKIGALEKSAFIS